MEKISAFERVVGDVPEVVKEDILRNKRERFDNQIFEELRNKEREKTPEELQIISLVNDATNKIRQKYGLKNFDIPPQNIHIIIEEALKKDKIQAIYDSMAQSVVMRGSPLKMVFMTDLFHEMIHFKSYNALQATMSENLEINGYRIGLTILTRDKKSYFTNLNEAVTEEITKRFAPELFDNPIFAKEMKQTKDIRVKYSRVAIDSKEPLSTNSTNDDIFCEEFASSKSLSEAVGRMFSTRQKIKSYKFIYPSERKILNILIDKIFEKNTEKFEDREGVFEVFAKSMMTGNILPIGRLIEKTFGSGTLRRVGELDQDIQKQEEFVNSL